MATNKEYLQGNQKKQKGIRRGKLPGTQRYRLQNLLFMKYKPSEIAKELGVDVKWFYRVYLPLGCPQERAENGQIWIVGSEFRDWYQATYRRTTLAKNEAYCVSCKKVVSIVAPKQQIKDGLTYSLSTCPSCDRTVAKILAYQGRKT